MLADRNKIYIHDSQLSTHDGEIGVFVNGNFYPIKIFSFSENTKFKNLQNHQADELFSQINVAIKEYIGNGVEGIVELRNMKLEKSIITVNSTVIRLPVGTRPTLSLGGVS